MDYEFLENLFDNQLREEANARVSPKEVTIYLRLPVTSNQLAVVKEEQGVNQPHLEDLQDVSNIIMSPTTTDKEDIIIDSESEKYEATASQLLLAHEEEVHLNSSQLSALHAAIKTEETSFDDEATICTDQGQQEEVWDFINKILSCQGYRRFCEPKGIDVDLMRDIIDERHNRTVNNEDCIIVVYNYVPDDDLSIPDEEYYVIIFWCEPPTDNDELYRKSSTCWIRKTPNGLGKRASKSTGQLNQRTN